MAGHLKTRMETTIIGEAATRAGLYLKQAEVHGMSQRGGDVQSNLRLST